MNIKKYLSIGMTFIFTSVTMQISLFAPKKVYAEVRSSYTESTIAGTGVAGYSGDGGAAISAKLSFPYQIASDSSGNVYIADFCNNAIRKVDHVTGNISTMASIVSPRSVAVDIKGDVYVSSGSNNIQKVDPSGNVSTIAGTGERGYAGDGGAATSAKLNDPYGIAVDVSENVYITDTGNNAIRKINHSTGIISTIANGLNQPYGVAVDNDENVYISDTYNYAIKKIDHTTGDISTISSQGTLVCPFQIAVDNSGNVYIADADANAIKKIDQSTGITSTISNGGLNNSIGVGVDASGNVYVASSNDNLIKKLTLVNSYYYAVTYDGNGNTAGTLPTDSTSYASGTSATAKEAWTLERTGYKFTGWNTSSDGKGLPIAEGQNFNVTGDTTLYAQWKEIVPASGLTVTAAPEATPVQGKVNLTVTPGAEDSNHKILYRIVPSEPTALNVGDEVEPSEGWITVTDTNAHEISVANGKYIEVVEVEWGICKVTKWGKSEVVKDGYVEPSSSSLNKTTVNFDKNPANAQDISINMELNGNTLQRINMAGDILGSGLVKDRDYTLDGNTVTIKKSYLEELLTGTTILVFNFSAGKPQLLNVIVTDTTSNDVSMSSTTANFDKNPANQADVNVSMGIGKYDLKNISGNGGYLPDDVRQGNTLTIKKSDLGKITPVAELTFGDEKGSTEGLIVTKQAVDAGIISNIVLTPNGGFGQTELTSITNEGNTLVKGTDYIVNGSQVTIKKGLLTKLGTGTVNFVLNFNKEHLAVTMSTNETEITATATLYKNTLTSITNGIYTLVNGKDYTVNGNNVTIKKDYLSTLSTGTAALVFNFSEGSPQTLNVAISGTTTKSYTVTFKDYDGSIIGEPQKVNDGESAIAPAAPTRTGYVFAGWDKTFDKVTGDLTITAKYTSGNTYDFPSKPTDKPGETKIPTDYLKSRDNTLVIINPAADLAIPASAIDLVDGADHIKVTEKVVTPETNIVQGLFSNLPSSVARMIGNPINLNVQLLDANDDLIKDIHQFSNNQKVKVTIKLTASQITGLDTSKLSMYYYDEISKIWAELGGSFDPNTNEFTFYTPHFTNFAIMDKVSTPTPIPTPTVSSYTVTFKDYDGTVIGTPQAVNYGGSATAPVAPTRTGYVFAGWDKAFDNITGDLVVTAKYTSGNTYNFKPTTTNNGDETKISADYLTSRDNTLVITSDNAEISMPAGAIDLADGTGYVKVVEQSEASTDVSKQYGNLPNGLKQVGNPLLISIQLFDANNNYIKDIHKLADNEKIKVTMKLTADQIKGIDPNVISMYYYDATAKAWIKLEGSFDSSTMKDTFYMTAF